MRKYDKANRLRVRRTTEEESDGTSPYWASTKGRSHDENGFVDECPSANPDVLSENVAMYADAKLPTRKEILGEAISHLQGRQKEVYLLLMRMNKSEYDTAKILGVSRDTVAVYKERAIKFVVAYCREAIAKGRTE